MRRYLSILVAMLLATPAYAAEDEEPKKATTKSEIAEILDSMGYPELQVVPKASERLVMETKSEDTSFLVTHWPIELVALGTLYVGMTAKSRNRTDLTEKEKKDSGTIASATTAIGAGWLIGSLIIGSQRPYRAGQRTLAKYPGKDDRSNLLRERLAEEALERPAKTMRMLQNLAVVSNVAVNAATLIHSNESGQVFGGAMILLSFLPWMFEDHNITVYDKHIEYKKKIYAPLRSASLSFDPVTRSVTPVTNLTWTF